MSHRTFVATAITLCSACTALTSRATAGQETAGLAIIPQPARMVRAEGAFVVNPQTPILLAGGGDEIKAIGLHLADVLNHALGCKLPVSEVAGSPAGKGAILLTTVDVPSELGDEGYELTAGPESVVIRAPRPAGLFYGIQSLRQLLPLNMEDGKKIATEGKWAIPGVRIMDQPRFRWRGLMLDCSRTFLTAEYLKRYVDLLACHKMNVLHLHLTDDQGWRMEISKYPRLTEIGSKFDPRFKDEVSGYYTKDQMRELVRYAASRYVTIVPEIEMPSHCLSVLAAYPELSCRQDKYVIAPYVFMGDSKPDKDPPTPYGVLCAGNDKVFEVMEDVLGEVFDVFPSAFIHIGGDECPKEFWKTCPKCQARMKAERLKDENELQSYFVRRIERFVVGRGRRLIGWDEILEGGLAPPHVAQASRLPRSDEMGLAPQTAVMSWRGMNGGIAAARDGHDVVMAPTSHCYFDYAHSTTPLDKTYSFEPIPSELTGDQRNRVLGAQACMWTHIARDEMAIDAMIFPRLVALAEAIWTPAERRQWDDFARRMEIHYRRLDAMKVTYFRPNAGLDVPNLTAGPNGKLWAVSAANEIFTWSEGKWTKFPGQARQVTVGPDGTVWAVGVDPFPGGYELFEWKGSQWQKMGQNAAAVQIAAAPEGSLWAVTDSQVIYRYTKGKWENMPGQGRQVAVGPDGTVWLVGTEPAMGGYSLLKWTGSQWSELGMGASATRIAAGNNTLWAISSNDAVRALADGRWQRRPGSVRQLAIGTDGTVWALRRDPQTPGYEFVHWTGNQWQKPSGDSKTTQMPFSR